MEPRRNFKTEAEEVPEDNWNIEAKRFRCPFRTEEGQVCGVHQDRLNEVLNHFYRHHFERTAKDSVFEEALACFHADCHMMFMTHDKLVKHLQSHNGGRDSLYYIKYIMDHMEEGKSDAIAWVRVEAEKEKKLVEEEKSQLNEKLNGTKKELEDAKGEMRKYRKKSDISKEKIAKLEAELKEVKAKFEAELKETKGSLENQQAGHDKLIEAKAKLEIKLDIQKTDNEELKRIKRAHEACGDTRLGEKVKKQERMIKKLRQLLRAKASENNQLSAKVLKLEIADSGDEEEMEDGEYMEEEA